MPDFTISPIDDMEAVIFGSFKRARAVLGVESFVGHRRVSRLDRCWSRRR